MNNFYKKVSELNIPEKGLSLEYFEIKKEIYNNDALYHIYKFSNAVYHRDNNLQYTIWLDKSGPRSFIGENQLYFEMNRLNTLIEEYNTYTNYF